MRKAGQAYGSALLKCSERLFWHSSITNRFRLGRGRAFRGSEGSVGANTVCLSTNLTPTGNGRRGPGASMQLTRRISILRIRGLTCPGKTHQLRLGFSPPLIVALPTRLRREEREQMRFCSTVEPGLHLQSACDRTDTLLLGQTGAARSNEK